MNIENISTEEKEMLLLLKKISKNKEETTRRNFKKKLTYFYQIDKFNNLDKEKYLVKYLTIYSMLIKFIKKQININNKELPFTSYLYYEEILKILNILEEKNFDFKTIFIIKELLKLEVEEEKIEEKKYIEIISKSEVLKKYFEEILKEIKTNISFNIVDEDIKKIKKKVYTKISFKLKKI